MAGMLCRGIRSFAAHPPLRHECALDSASRGLSRECQPSIIITISIIGCPIYFFLFCFCLPAHAYSRPAVPSHGPRRAAHQPNQQGSWSQRPDFLLGRHGRRSTCHDIESKSRPRRLARRNRLGPCALE
ncbi:hypothetical protein BJY01DRAFT_220831 [Aspergillus pseudoustus]|uniref:Uncharacterized protein n=1 Tax=Aspergillus pseudoustus TaxID=1810923 RepID=A0ABR4JBX9_9EURO